MSSLIQERLAVAVVDDDAVFRDLTCAFLSAKSPFVHFPAASGDELIRLLSEQPIDCIILDYNLGDDTGFAIKTRLDQQFADPLPIVMLTGDDRQSTAIKAFRMGVSDYLPKHNLRPKALAATIAQVVATDRQRQSSKAEHKRLIETASIDIVTGLAGKSYLDERLTQLGALQSEARRSYAIILVELLQYQVITEQFGLKVSDFAARSFGKQLKLNTRSNDICGRYENGIFIVIADVKFDTDTFDQFCDRLAHNLSMNVESDNAKLKLSACVAGMMCGASDADGLVGPSLLDGALALLAQAKASEASCRVALAPSPALPAEELACPAAAATPAACIDAIVLPAADRLRTTDRRREPRQRVYKRGIIHVPDKHSTFDCTVRNLSVNGAGLRINFPFAVPASFHLEIVGSGYRRKVCVRWQSSLDLGVEYVAE